MGNIAKNIHSKFDLNATRNDGALGFFQRASPPNNNNKKKKKKKISSVWGPVPGPKTDQVVWPVDIANLLIPKGHIQRRYRAIGRRKMWT